MPITAEVEDPSGVALVRVRYRIMNQGYAYESLVLDRSGDTFSGVIPGEAIQPDWDFVYYLEPVDEAGNGCIYPDWKKEPPYVIVEVDRD